LRLGIADEKANEVRNGFLSVEAALAVAVAELLDNIVACSSADRPGGVSSPARP
jgi:hypothetical protein